MARITTPHSDNPNVVRIPYDEDLDFLREVLERDELGRPIGMKPGYTGGALTDEQLERYKVRRRNRLQVLGLPDWERG